MSIEQAIEAAAQARTICMQGQASTAPWPRSWAPGPRLFATGRGQQVIDRAVQLRGGDGVKSGEPVEKLYREIRALRIHEGASDMQRVIIARSDAQRAQGR